MAEGRGGERRLLGDHLRGRSRYGDLRLALRLGDLEPRLRDLDLDLSRFCGLRLLDLLFFSDRLDLSA